MYIYTSSAGLTMESAPDGLRVEYRGESLRMPVLPGEPLWKAASWAAKSLEHHDPLVELYRKQLARLGVWVLGDVVCMPPSYGDEVLLASWVLTRRGGYLLDVTGDMYR